jgi:hypothetical protein
MNFRVVNNTNKCSLALSLSLSIYLSIYLSVCLSVYVCVWDTNLCLLLFSPCPVTEKLQQIFHFPVRIPPGFADVDLHWPTFYSGITVPPPCNSLLLYRMFILPWLLRLLFPNSTAKADNANHFHVSLRSFNECVLELSVCVQYASVFANTVLCLPSTKQLSNIYPLLYIIW